MKKKNFNYLIAVVGLLLLATGLILLKVIDNLQGILLVAPYICIGLGCGAFGHVVGDIVNNKVAKNNPQLFGVSSVERLNCYMFCYSMLIVSALASYSSMRS